MIRQEIYEDIKPDIIIGCIGGGGLMAGISKYSNYINPDCLLYGVETDNCNAMYLSIKANKIIKLEYLDLFVDGAAVKQVGDLTFDICKKYLNDILLVSNGKLSKTLLELFQNDGIITEPAGALKKFVNNILGDNDDITRFEYIKKTNKTYGQVLIGIELTHQNDLRRIIDNLKLYGFQYKYVNDDELLMSYLI